MSGSGTLLFVDAWTASGESVLSHPSADCWLVDLFVLSVGGGLRCVMEAPWCSVRVK